MLTEFSVRVSLSAVDIVFAFLAPFISLAYRFLTTGPYPVGLNFHIYVLISAVSTTLLLRSSGVSRVSWRFFSSYDAFSAGCSIALGVIVAVVAEYFVGALQAFPRSVPLVHILVQLGAFAAPRFIARFYAARPVSDVGRATRVLLIGCNETAFAYLAAVRSLAGGSIRIAAALTHDPTMVGNAIGGAPIIGTFNRFVDALALLATHGVEVRRIIFAAADEEIDPAMKEQIIAEAARRELPLIDIHTLFTEVTSRAEYDELGFDSLLLRGPYWTGKRIVDAVSATLMLVAFVPVIALVAVVVAVDIGAPVIFWQERFGREGRKFLLYKFRTMRSPGEGVGIDADDAARMTRVGSFLRRTRLDELPQLWNIVRGDMSFIGPRPLLREDQPDNVSRRLSVRPGLSGWAQVNGGRLTTPEEKGALDLWYISNANLALDLKILILTFRSVIGGDNYDPVVIEEARAFAAVEESEPSFREIQNSQ